MKDLIPLALAVIGFLITLTPNQLGAKLEHWTPYVIGGAVLNGMLAGSCWDSNRT